MHFLQDDLVVAVPCGRHIHRLLQEEAVADHNPHQLPCAEEAVAAGQTLHRGAEPDNLQELQAAVHSLQELEEADQILAEAEAVRGAGQTHLHPEAGQTHLHPEAGQTHLHPEAGQTHLEPEAAGQTHLHPAAGQTLPELEAVGQTHLHLAASQTLPEPEAAGQTHLHPAAGQTLPGLEAAGQTLPGLEAAGQTHLHPAADQILPEPEAAGQTLHHPEVDQIQAQEAAHQNLAVQVVGQIQAPEAVGQTLADQVACQMPEAAVGLQILEVPQAHQEERHRSHRTCRRASLVRRIEGSSWSPSRDGGPSHRPPRRQHTVLPTPRIKIEVEFVHRLPTPCLKGHLDPHVSCNPMCVVRAS